MRSRNLERKRFALVEFSVRWAEMEAILRRKDAIIIDLRTAREYKGGHVRGAVNIPENDMDREKNRLRRYREIYLYCDRGNVSLLVCQKLRREGYRAFNVWGGVHTLRSGENGRQKNLVDAIWEKH